MNLQWSDNCFQAVFIFGCMLLMAVVGAVWCLYKPNRQMPWFAGAMMGGFVGVVIGLFTSGFFLMIYRVIRHARGQHD